MAGVDDSDQPSEQVQRSPEYAFTVESPEKQDSGLVTVVVGGVELPDVLIDSGATCNLIGQQTWNMLKKKGIKCESRKTARELYAYGSTEPLPTLGTFTADVVLADNNSTTCTADFVVIEGEGRTLLGREAAEVLNLLLIGPLQANNDLTSNGVNPSKEKVADIRDARPPKDASEVRSFMDLVQYSATFMPDIATVMGCGTANSLSRVKASNYPGRDSCLLQGWMQDKNRGGRVPSGLRGSSHPAAGRDVES